MTLHRRHDVLSVSWNKYPSIVFNNVIMCFCDTGDRFCVCSYFAVNCLESVNQKSLNHLFAATAHLCSAGRSEAGGDDALGVFLVIQPRNHHTLLQIGRVKSKLAHHQLLFRLSMSFPHGKHLVRFSAPRSTRDGTLPTAGLSCRTQACPSQGINLHYTFEFEG